MRGSGIAITAAISGTTAVMDSAALRPSRSPRTPTTGARSEPTPHANPIINDETVAALTGAICCPNVTLTGSVDCRRKPPTETSMVSSQPDANCPANKNGTEATSDQMITCRGPYLSATGPPRKPPTVLTNRYSETAALASLTPIP